MVITYLGSGCVSDVKKVGTEYRLLEPEPICLLERVDRLTSDAHLTGHATGATTRATRAQLSKEGLGCEVDVEIYCLAWTNPLLVG